VNKALCFEVALLNTRLIAKIYPSSRISKLPSATSNPECNRL
jgi:hypothetical protein